MSESFERDRPGRWNQFSAIFKYEILWNLRKKKVLAMFVISIGLISLGLFLPYLTGSGGSRPGFILGNIGPTGFVIVLLGAVVSMNSISGEFENGTISSLVSKPVSRGMVYLAKLSAMLAILLVIYSVLDIYLIVGGWLLYGPQEGLSIAAVGLPFLATLSTAVWISLALAIGSWTKNSVLVALGVIGLFFGISIAGGIVSVTTSKGSQSLNYLPGSGESGNIPMQFTDRPVLIGQSVSSGTDSITQNFLVYSYDSSAKALFKEYQLNLENMGSSGNPLQEVGFHTSSLSTILERSIAVALIYIIVFNLIAWRLFDKAEVIKG